MKLTRYGHASLLVESGQIRVLVDPGSYSAEWRDLRDLSAVLITHEHHDHFDREGLIDLTAANPSASVFAPAGVSESLLSADVNAHMIEPEAELEIGDLHIEAVGGQHAVVHRRIPRITNVGFVFSVSEGPRTFHPGDSFDVAPPDINILALPLTAPWSSVAMTADFLEAVSPSVAFPIHDAGASRTGHATHMRLLGRLLPVGTKLLTVDPLGSVEP